MDSTHRLRKQRKQSKLCKQSKQSKHIFRLQNGITVLIVPMDTVLTDISVNILLGENNESESESGITHYIEHLLSYLTSKKYQDYNEIKHKLANAGAIVNASTSEYYTKVFIKGYYKDIELFIDLLANCISNFYPYKEYIQQEKNAVIQELLNYISQNDYQFTRKIWKHMHPQLAYQKDYTKNIRKVRQYNTEHICDFIKSKVCTNNIVVSVACPKSAVSKTGKLIRKHFNFRNMKKQVKLVHNSLQYKNDKLRIIFVKNNNNTNNAIIRMYVNTHIKLYSDEYLALSILRNILFNFETGTFYNILRKQLGLVYYIDMVIDADMIDPLSSKYYIETTCDRLKTREVISTILKIIKEVCITDEQIANARKMFLIQYEQLKFVHLTSYTEYYERFLLSKVPIIEHGEVYKRIKTLDNAVIHKSLAKLKHKLKNSLVFYYSSHKK